MEAIIEILAKSLGLDLMPQISIGGCNDADIGGAASGTAHRTIGPVLEEAQEFDLGRRTERIDLIQEERALLGFSDEPFLCGRGIRIRPLRMPKEFIFHEVVRQGTTV